MAVLVVCYLHRLARPLAVCLNEVVDGSQEEGPFALRDCRRALKRGRFGKVVGLPRRRPGAWMPHGDCPAHSLFGLWVQGGYAAAGGMPGLQAESRLAAGVSIEKSEPPMQGTGCKTAPPRWFDRSKAPVRSGNPSALQAALGRRQSEPWG